MLKKAILHFWSLRHEFTKYFIIGVSGVALDLGSLHILQQYVHLRPVTSVVLNQLFLLNYVFLLNKYWAFKARGITRIQIVRFYILAGVNYLISIVWIYFFSERLGVHPLVARLGNIILTVAWNFLLYKHWVYKQEARFVENDTILS